MVEGYFYGDEDALVRAGVARGVNLHLVHPDPECFETRDPAWLPECQERNRKKSAKGMRWWREEMHAKRYLEHLVARNGGDGYREVDGGVRAFQDLAWRDLSSVATEIAFARALFGDLADFLGVENPLGGTPSALTYPIRPADRAHLLLRNI